MTGFVLRRSETDYVVNCDAQGNGGYNVVPKTLDRWNKYDISEVEAYLAKHPEMLIDMQAIEAENARLAEIASLKAYLSSTDYIYPKCMELDLDPSYVYPDIVSKRKEARQRIQELQDFDK